MTHQATITNPVLRGMYPDPSWIWDERRGEAVLVNSSFELIPGLPIHTTRDFVTWTHAADAVDEAMARRLLIDGVEDSGGLYAPTLRRIAGRYAIACTTARVDGVRTLAAGCAQRDLDDCRAADGNFVIVADRLEGPWQGPYWVHGAEGIDPDLFEDVDGTVWWTQTRPAADPQWDGQTEIWTAPIDPDTWTLRGHKTVIWRGYGLDAVWAEGPHLYRVGDWTYLMTAEGGTSFEHSEMMMRAFTPHGFGTALNDFAQDLAARGARIAPARDGESCVVGTHDRLFAACKRNPILTHRHLGLGELTQCVGHADLMRHPRVGWMIACLGVRETPGGRDGELFSYFGRETFIAPVRWEQTPVSWKLDGDGPSRRDDDADPGWPTVAPGLGRLPRILGVTLDGDGMPVELDVPDAPAQGGSGESDAGMAVPGDPAPGGASRARLIPDGDDRLVAVRGRGDYRFLRVDGPDFTAVAGPGRTLMLHQDMTHAVTMRVESNGDGSLRLVADVTDRGRNRRLDLGGLALGELFGLRLDSNRLDLLVLDAADCQDLASGGATDADDSAAMIVSVDGDRSRTLHTVDARFLSAEWSGGFVGCLVGVRHVDAPSA